MQPRVPDPPPGWRPYADPVPPLKRPRGAWGALLGPGYAVVDALRRARHGTRRQRRTAWQRRGDWVLALSLPAALAVQVLLGVTVLRSERTAFVHGQVWREDGGGVVGKLCDPDRALPPWTVAVPLGVFRFEALRQSWGWPLGVRIAEPVVVEDWLGFLPEFGLAQARPTIDRLMERQRREGFPDVSSPRASWRPLPLLLMSVATWPCVYLVGLVGLAGIRFLSGFGAARAARRSEIRDDGGRCPRCGYDLRGSPWSQRCPECGAEQPLR